ncbi:MAG: S8 family serine peptidase, partial [Bdellovibrionales bacterium]|nr:S8 family serine peptidase [Bdellovibrionales bacterium]
AGVIGAMGNNGIGITGINWRVKIMPLRFLNASGSGTTDGAIAAIEYAIEAKQRGVNLRVLSNSWGGAGASQALEAAIEAARQEGILFVAAAGNSGSDNDTSPIYPASYGASNILAVAAIDSDGNRASFSNYGAHSVDLAAPGVSILSTYTGGGYKVLSGTSMAAPHVAGVAALLLAAEPSLSLPQLRTRLVGTVTPLSTLSGQLASAGTINAYNALSNTQTIQPPPVSSFSYHQTAQPAPYQETLDTRLMNADDAYVTVELPFDFSFFGESFSRIAVSTNGRIVPLVTGAEAPTTSDYANALTQGIAPYHDDLYPATAVVPSESGVWLHQSEDEVVITWIMIHYAHRASPTAESVVRFQVVLEASGAIYFRYGDTLAGSSNLDYGASATIGVAPVAGFGGKSLLISHNTPAPALVGSGKSLRLSAAHPTIRDFDGDGRSDIVVWRPAFGYWFVLLSSTDFSYAQHKSFQFGLPGDIPAPGDFDGDGMMDLAVFRPTWGLWYVAQSSSGFSSVTATQWGLPGDIPLPQDYDGDGRADLAVWRPSSGMLYVLRSSSGFNREAALLGSQQAFLTVQAGG